MFDKNGNSLQENDWIIFPSDIDPDQVELGQVEYAGKHRVIIKTKELKLRSRSHNVVERLTEGEAALWILENQP